MAQYAYLNGAGNFQVKVGAAKIRGLVVAAGTSPTVAIYDTPNGTVSAATTVAPTMTFATVPQFPTFGGAEPGAYLNNGLFIVLGGTTPQVTVIYD